MLKTKKSAIAAFAAACLLASLTWAGTAAAREVNSPAPASLAKGETEVMHLLKLMDKDQNGKVSKEEFMKFMDAEFDRLDTDKSGELDVRELTQSRVRTRSAISR
jgi:hypothetical protein